MTARRRARLMLARPGQELPPASLAAPGDHMQPVGADRGPGASGHTGRTRGQPVRLLLPRHRLPPAQHLSGVQQDLPSDTSPCSMAVQALAWVLRLRGSQPAVELMDQERGWQLLEEAQPERFALLSRAIVTHPNRVLKSIPWLLLPSLQASQEGEHMACTVLFAEFLGSPLLMENDPKAMWKQIVKAMLQQTEDSNIHIRGRALHGLRNAVTEFPDKVRKKRDQILGSFVHAVCKSCDPRVILDTMEGLCWMLRDPKAPLKVHVAVPLDL
ncbi:maestro heat-like repeat-containing protein family member 1 [Mauremys mutica]|uniref:maestro heat-like repeat-containing protein family member 1 n=1 Tax=Mauremys mutica TaxID=74926 RepID=UPI001D1401E0|nr:maestro heat-like repeat-containing protein family member 1 [Mauremys mutica]